MRLNIQAQVDLKTSIIIDNDDVKFLLEHQKNVENTIKNMVFNAFGGDYCGEDGFQKISLKIFQNQLTDVGSRAILKSSNDKELKNEVDKQKSNSKKRKKKH